MATNWPNSVQTFTNPSAGDSLNSPSHSAQHTTVNDTVEALQEYAGMVLVKTQTVGSGVSSVTVNGAFSSTFDNYRIIMTGGTQSSGEDLKLKLGSSATGYYGFLVYGSSGAGTVLGANLNNRTQFDWIGGGVAGQAAHVMVDLLSPFTATYTKIRNASYQNGGNYGTTQGEHRVASSYSSFEILTSIGTITGGTIRVYGYNNG